MQTDIRLVAQIYRAIGDSSPMGAIDELKCRHIARLIARSDDRDRLEALVEQYADCIETMSAFEFVDMLRHQAGCVVVES
jgi:hypothetical protein